MTPEGYGVKKSNNTIYSWLSEWTFWFWVNCGWIQLLTKAHGYFSIAALISWSKKQDITKVRIITGGNDIYVYDQCIIWGQMWSEPAASAHCIPTLQHYSSLCPFSSSCPSRWTERTALMPLSANIPSFWDPFAVFEWPVCCAVIKSRSWGRQWACGGSLVCRQQRETGQVEQIKWKPAGQSATFLIC